MKKHYLLYLQQFAEGADGDTGETSQDAAGNTGEATTQDAAAETQETEETFDDLIKGRFKGDFDKAVQKIMRQRFAKAKATEEKLAKMAPAFDILAPRYGTTADDIDSIVKYLQEDDAMYEEAAYKAGMTVDQYKQYSRVMAENQRLLAERQANEQRQAANAQLAQWREEEAQLKQEFPNFDLDTLIQNETFYRMVGQGVPLRNAYIAMDADGILQGAMNYTAQQVAKKTASTIAQRGSRPMEGGMSGQASAKVGTDVSKMSNADIADYVRRAAMGERISL